MVGALNALFGVALEADGYETTGTDNIADGANVLLLGLEDYGRHPGPGSRPRGLAPD
jgi:hypothetical protein